MVRILRLQMSLKSERPADVNIGKYVSPDAQCGILSHNPSYFNSICYHKPRHFFWPDNTPRSAAELTNTLQPWTLWLSNSRMLDQCWYSSWISLCSRSPLWFSTLSTAELMKLDQPPLRHKRVRIDTFNFFSLQRGTLYCSKLKSPLYRFSCTRGPGPAEQHLQEFFQALQYCREQLYCPTCCWQYKAESQNRFFRSFENYCPG